MAYSGDLRSRVIRLVKSGRSCRSVALQFQVSPSFVIKTLQHYQRTGETVPLAPRKQRTSKLDPHLDFLSSLISDQSDITLCEMAQVLSDKHDLRISPSSIHKFLVKTGYSFKKSHWQHSNS